MTSVTMSSPWTMSATPSTFIWTLRRAYGSSLDRPRMDELSRDGRRGGDPGVRQVHARLGRSHAAPEVPVGRRDGILAGGEDAVRAAEARAARRRRDDRPGLDELVEEPLGRCLPPDRLRRRHDDRARA